MNKRATLFVFVLLVGLSGLAFSLNLTLGHNWGGDFSAYIMQARSITEASPRGFIDVNRFSSEQSSEPLLVTYPWGFPLLLTPFYALFGFNLLALKSAGVVAYLLFLCVRWFAFRRVHPAASFLCLVALFALNPTMIAFSNDILSDLPFLLASTLCVALIQEVVVKERRIVSPLADQALVGAAIMAASQIRTNGFLLLVPLALCFP